MNTIYFVMGKSSSGKDSISNELIRYSGMKYLMPCTTRPMRRGESEGNPYHFIKESQVEDEMIAKAVYHREDGSYYFVFMKQLLEIDSDYLAVASPEQITELFKTYGKDFKLVVIEIITDEENRIIHAIEREEATDKNYKEVCRRIRTDRQDFTMDNSDYEMIMKNADDLFKLYNDYEMKPDEIAKEFLDRIGYRRNEE